MNEVALVNMHAVEVFTLLGCSAHIGSHLLTFQNLYLPSSRVMHISDNQSFESYKKHEISSVSLRISSSLKQARELNSGPCLGAKARFLSFNRTQSRALTGLTGHNTLRRHLHLLGLPDSPLCRRCGVNEET